MAPMKTNENIKVWRPSTLCCELLLLLAVMNTTKASAALNLDKDVSTNYSMTLFAVFDGMTKVSLQVPLEIEDVSTPPHHGSVWSWSAEMLDGFNSRTPTISFTHENDTSGFNTKAVLHFDLSDWVHDESGVSADGSFVLKLSNGTPAENRLYNMSVTLRSITEGFTIIEGQSKTPTSNEPGFSAAGKEGLTTAVDMFDWGVNTPPSSESLTINPEGRVIDYDFGSGTWNVDGTCRLSITDGSRPTSTLTGINVSLRSLVGDGYTVINDQTSSEGGVSAVGTKGFSIGADMFDWGVSTPPSNESLTINPEGRVIDYDFGNANWTENGTFRIRLKDGSRPSSYVTGRSISLRQLIGDGSTVISGQTSSESGVSAGGANGFSIGADMFDWNGAAPSVESLTFDAMAAITDYDFGNANWTENGTFRIKLQDGNRPASYVAGRGISLRGLVGNGYTVIKGQTSCEPGVNAAGANGFVVTAAMFDWGTSVSPSAQSLTFNAFAAITSYNFTNANWTENGTFRIGVQDGSRPASYVTGHHISLRRIVPNPLTIPDNGRAGGINLQVEGDVGPWDWTDYEDGLANSDLTAPDAFDSPKMTVSWAAGALESDETGTGTVTIQRSDGSSPASTVALETTVNEAPQLPVAYWPILATVLAVIAVVLIRSQRKRTLH